MNLKDLNKAVCDLYRKALDDSTGAPLLAEDVTAPIVRPSGKVMLESGSDTRMTAAGRDRSATFRLYYFSSDRHNPKTENLMVRMAICDAFLDGITVGDDYIGLDNGVQFEIADGVLETTLELTWQEPVPEDSAEAYTDPDASTEPMEILNQTMEVS